MNMQQGFGDNFWNPQEETKESKRDFFDEFKIVDSTVGKLSGLVGSAIIIFSSIFFDRIFLLLGVILGLSFIFAIFNQKLFPVQLTPFFLLSLTFLLAIVQHSKFATLIAISSAITITAFGYSMSNQRIFDQSAHLISLITLYPLNVVVMFFSSYNLDQKISIYSIFISGIAGSRIAFLFIAPLSKSLLASNKRSQMLNRIAKNSRNIQERDPREVANSALEIIMQLGARSACFISADRRFQNVQLGEEIENVEEIAKRCLETGKTLSIYSTYGSNNAIYAVPIKIGGRFTCVIIAKLLRVPAYESSLLESYEILANQTARALDNANLTAEDRRLVEQLTDESLRDQLTGLGNRRFAEQAMTRLADGDIVVMIDLDGLKHANDTHGHSAGDEILKNVGIFLSQNIRNPDVAARIGGDEFLLILKNARNAAESLLERIRSAWESYHIYDTSFSVGFSVHTTGNTPQSTLQKADAGLYRSKEEGKNKITKVV